MLSKGENYFETGRKLETSIFSFHQTVFTSRRHLGRTCKNRIKHQGLYHSPMILNSLPNDKFLGLPKLKAFADDNLDVTQDIKVVFHRIENIVEKEENAGHQHFLLFPQCFRKAFSSSASKVVIV